MTYSKAYYQALERQLRDLIGSLKQHLSSPERKQFEHFVDHDEYGEALHNLAWTIVEANKRVPLVSLEAITDLARRMGMESELPEGLLDHATDESSGRPTQ